MKKSFTVKIDTYPFVFFFVIGYPDDEVIALLERKLTGALDDNTLEKVKISPESYGYTIHFENSLCLIRFVDFDDDSCVDHGRLSHEISHAVQMMFEWIDTKLTTETSEAYAYLDQFLTERFIKEIRRAKNREHPKRRQKK